MAIWMAKAVLQKAISFLPNKHRVNYFFQKYITHGLELTDALFESKLHHAGQHIKAYEQYIETGSGAKSRAPVSLELGTGWYPVVPMALFLSGFEKMYSADIVSFLTTDRIKITLQKYISYHDENKLQKLIGVYDATKIELFRSMMEINDQSMLLEKLNLQLLLGDIRKNIIPEKVHLIHSNNTFEHIPYTVLTSILHFFHSVISPHGVMSHFIDLSDHFSHLDTSITSYNFLRYSPRAWRWIDNSIQPQNRMRISQYRNIFFANGWCIQLEENVTGTEADLSSIQLDQEFATLSTADVLVTHSWIVATIK